MQKLPEAPNRKSMRKRRNPLGKRKKPALFAVTSGVTTPKSFLLLVPCVHL